MFMPEESYLKVWEFPITGPDTSGEAPEHVVAACHAVGRDLQCRWHRPDTYTQNCVWTISLVGTGLGHIALKAGPRPRHKTEGTSPLRGFGFGETDLDQSAQKLTVLIAGEVQDQLAGGMPYVQWPIDTQRLLMPSLRDGHAVWVARSSDRVVAEIGTLCSH